MRVTFAGIVLNEAQYLEANLRQHYALCDEWIIVEGADRRWPANSATEEGLSIDDTAEIIRDFPDPDRKIKFIRHGWGVDKCELRNRYAELADDGVLIVIDADEFLTHASTEWLIERCKSLPGPGSVRIPHVHFWKHDSQIITGGYYDVPHDRAYLWMEGCRYLDNHNHPCLPDGRALWELRHDVHDRSLIPCGSGRVTHTAPAWLHYGFVKPADAILAKNSYYLARGEAQTRPQTTKDRAAWFTDLTAGCDVLPWCGPWPEAMKR